MRNFVYASVLLFVFFFLGCSCISCLDNSCVEKTWQRVTSPNGKLEVRVSGRTCGSASGFVVTLAPPGEEKAKTATIFMARIKQGRDANSQDNANAVTAEWISDTKLLISYADWIARENTGPMSGPPAQPRYGNITVEFKVKS